jgi:phospholipid/cholesterol/gamma-HCH transport system ATP-binding protein
VNKRFGMLFQNSALFDSLSVLDNVAFPLIHAHGRKKAEARSAARDTLPRLGLEEAVADLKPAELSGGMRKRVALARAIVAEPEIIFFDEPTTGLDPIMSAVINDLVNNQVRRLGAAAVTITHDLSSASAIGDRVGFLYQGEIVWEGPLDQLYDSGDERVDQFVNGRAEGPIPVLKS